eukprot:8825089-Ditylum_brightwellii.AAC.1
MGVCCFCATGFAVCKCGMVIGAGICGGACGFNCCGGVNNVLNISASFWIAAICSSPTARNGIAGVGFDRQWMRSSAACDAASLDAITSIFIWLGKNSTVSAILSLQVACT